MNKCKTVIVTGICTLAMCFGIFTNDAEAAEVSGSGIRAKVVLSGTIPQQDETNIIEMVAENKDTPMPAGSKDGVCCLAITGAGEKNFPEITYSEPGVYHYIIRQRQGADENCSYDDTRYNLLVTVMNSEADPDGFAVSCALYDEEMSEKQEELIFENRYESTGNGKMEKYTPRTGDTSETGLYVMGILLFVVVIGIRCLNSFTIQKSLK